MPSNAPGYLLPTPLSPALPGGLTLTQFMQQVLVGVSGIDGTLVRPNWQTNPPKQPALEVNWIAFGVAGIIPDANMAEITNAAGETRLRRQEGFEIACSFYGPLAMEYATEVRDAFQIQQNLDAMFAVGIGFQGVSGAMAVPDLINERWINRVTMSIFFRREIVRSYPILSLVAANGTIYTTLNGDAYNLLWQTPEET